MAKQPVLRIGGDARQATKAMTTVRTGLTRMKDVAKRVGATMKNVLMAPFKALKFGFGIIARLKYHLMGLIALGGLSIRAHIKQALATRTLKMAVDAMGYSWDEWGGKITKCLNSLQKFTNYGDEETAVMFKELMLAGMKPQKILESMPRIMDLCTAAGYDMASGAEYIARAWTGEYSILKRNLPLIAGLMKDMDAMKKKRGRELTQLEAWNMMMDMAGSKISNLAAETRALNPYPALLNELGDNMEKLGASLAVHVNPRIEWLTTQLEKLKGMEIGAALDTLGKKLKDPRWLVGMGQTLTGIVYDAIVLGFQMGWITIKKIMRGGIGMPASEAVSGAEFMAKRGWAGITGAPGEALRRMKSRLTTPASQWKPFEQPAWAGMKPRPVYPITAEEIAADRTAAMEAFGAKFAGRKTTLRKLTAPIVGALKPEGELTHAVLMRKFLMNQTTAEHRGQLAGII